MRRIAGRPLIEWSWRAAREIPVFERVVVATDADEVEACVAGFDGEVVRTREDHPSGTDRVEETAGILGLDERDVVVNLQADEPFVDGPTVARAVAALEGRQTPHIATVAAPIRDREEWLSPGVVKVARAEDGRALYFSRAPVPYDREGEGGWGSGAEGSGPDGEPPLRLRHVGVYACARSTLRRWAALAESPLERLERLEQLRALEAGLAIHVEIGPWTEPGIDVPADLERAERVYLKVG